MNLLDLPLALDNPLDRLLAFHRRIERHLATLGRLPGWIEVEGMGHRTAGAASALVEFFSAAVPLHHAHEERHLFPLMEHRLAAGPACGRFRDARALLEADHRLIDSAWRRLRRPLEALAEGVERPLPDDAVEYFRALYSVHIPAEEAAIHRLAARCLGARDLDTLARRLDRHQGGPR